jgi:hypothetical protein
MKLLVVSRPALFSPPLPEPCLQLLPHTALQFPVTFQFVSDASRVTCWSIHCTPCLPSPRTRLSLAPTTMETPSPWGRVDGHSPQKALRDREQKSRIEVSPSQVCYGGWRSASCRASVRLSLHHRFSLQLHPTHRTGGYYYPTYLQASPLLAMLPFPEWFPIQSKALCPERFLLSTLPFYEGIPQAVRRRTLSTSPI